MNSDNKSSKCIKSCGFFGSPETQSMCSKCYMFDSMANFRPFKPLEPIKTKIVESATDAMKRCESCRKKVGLAAGFECRCGKIFCGSHRYPDQHQCDFDFKGRDREILARDVFLVRADKLEHRI